MQEQIEVNINPADTVRVISEQGLVRTTQRVVEQVIAGNDFLSTKCRITVQAEEEETRLKLGFSPIPTLTINEPAVTYLICRTTNQHLEDTQPPLRTAFGITLSRVPTEDQLQASG